MLPVFLGSISAADVVLCFLNHNVGVAAQGTPGNLGAGTRECGRLMYISSFAMLQLLSVAAQRVSG